jgi:hypothetical protein
MAPVDQGVHVWNKKAGEILKRSQREMVFVDQGIHVWNKEGRWDIKETPAENWPWMSKLSEKRASTVGLQM